MLDRRRVDGFQVVSGTLGVVSGLILLARGAPAGWSFLLVAAGVVILVAVWVISTEATFEALDRTHAMLAVVGVVCVALAVVYLTRAADDLPRGFPGHDGDSENFRLVPGMVMAFVGMVALGRMVASVGVRSPSR